MWSLSNDDLCAIYTIDLVDFTSDFDMWMWSLFVDPVGCCGVCVDVLGRVLCVG